MLVVYHATLRRTAPLCTLWECGASSSHSNDLHAYAACGPSVASAQALEEGEFTCPVCRRIANMIIPMQAALPCPAVPASSPTAPTPPSPAQSVAAQNLGFIGTGAANSPDGALSWLHSAEWDVDGAEGASSERSRSSEPMDEESESGELKACALGSCTGKADASRSGADAVCSPDRSHLGALTGMAMTTGSGSGPGTNACLAAWVGEEAREEASKLKQSLHRVLRSERSKLYQATNAIEHLLEDGDMPTAMLLCCCVHTSCSVAVNGIASTEPRGSVQRFFSAMSGRQPQVTVPPLRRFATAPFLILHNKHDPINSLQHGSPTPVLTPFVLRATHVCAKVADARSLTPTHPELHLPPRSHPRPHPCLTTRVSRILSRWRAFVTSQPQPRGFVGATLPVPYVSSSSATFVRKSMPFRS